MLSPHMLRMMHGCPPAACPQRLPPACRPGSAEHHAALASRRTRTPSTGRWLAAWPTLARYIILHTMWQAWARSCRSHTAAAASGAVQGRQGAVPRSQELRVELCRQVLALRAARAPAAPVTLAPHDWLRGCRRAWDVALRSRDASALLARMQAGRYLHAGGWRASAT